MNFLNSLLSCVYAREFHKFNNYFFMSHFPYQLNHNENSSKIERNLRLSLDVGSNDRFRNTISYDYNPTPSFRKSIAVNNFRNSLDIDLAQHFVHNILSKKNPQNSSYSNLKNTLS